MEAEKHLSVLGSAEGSGPGLLPDSRSGLPYSWHVDATCRWTKEYLKW